LGVLLSRAEKKFLEDLLADKLEGYSYIYQRMLRKRILAKKMSLAEDIYLITRAEQRLQNLPSKNDKPRKKR
jgi:hypothetical protein